MAKPAVVLVGADKGGVGKTTVARALLDYFVAHNIPTRAFDTEAPKGTLKRFHPDITDVVDITSTADQMKIFDTLVKRRRQDHRDRHPRRPAVQDAARRCATSASSTPRQRPRSRSRCSTCSAPRSPRSSEIRDTAAFMDDAHYILVKNFINNTTFFEWDPATYNTYFKKIKDAHEITIPKLNEMACEQVELASVPYVSFVANKTADGQSAAFSFVLRGYVRHWLGNVWAEFDRVKLTEMVEIEQQRAQRSGPPAGRDPQAVMHAGVDATADARLHRHVVAPARRQDADRPRAHRIFLRAAAGRSPPSTSIPTSSS